MIRLVLILLLLPVMVFSQNYKDTFEVVTIQTAQKFYLNSGNRALIGGKSRIAIPVILPENTVSWYYTLVTTNSKENETEAADNVSGKIQLTSQLVNLMEKTAKIAAASFNPATLITSLATAPSGGELCEVYLLDRENKFKFLEKHDKLFSPFKYVEEGSRQQFNSGTVPINSIRTGTWYLGFKNPTAMTGMYVSVEIAAITKRKVKVEVAPQVAEASSKASSYRILAEEQFNNGNYSKSIEYSKKILELYPKSPLAYFRIGNCKILSNNSSEALDDYITGISLTSNDPNAGKLLGTALNNLNRIQSQNPNVQGFDDIKKLLQNELKRYQVIR